MLHFSVLGMLKFWNDDSLVGQPTTDNASPTQDQDVGFSAKPFFSSTITSIMVGTSVGLSSTTTIQRRTRSRTRMQTTATTTRTPSVCSEATWPTVSCSTTKSSSASSSLASRLRLRRAGSIKFCCYFCFEPWPILPICLNIELQ